MLEAGVARSCVVEGEHGPGRPPPLQGRLEGEVAVDPRVLGQLDHHTAQVALVAEHLPDRRVLEDVGPDVDGEEGVGRQGGAAGERCPDGGRLELGHPPQGDGGLEPGDRRSTGGAAGGPARGEAGQALVAHDQAAHQVDDRLVVRLDPALEQGSV
jgi:hypothetical protein